MNSPPSLLVFILLSSITEAVAGDREFSPSLNSDPLMELSRRRSLQNNGHDGNNKLFKSNFAQIIKQKHLQKEYNKRKYREVNDVVKNFAVFEDGDSIDETWGHISPNRKLVDDCNVGEIKFEIGITTDDYPKETTWTIMDMNTLKLVEAGGPFMMREHLHEATFCLESGHPYSFTIWDSKGDGIWSGFTSGYTLTLDGTVIKESLGYFGMKDVTVFGGCDTDSDCADQDTCTLDTCNSTTNLCEYTSLDCGVCSLEASCSSLVCTCDSSNTQAPTLPQALFPDMTIQFEEAKNGSNSNPADESFSIDEGLTVFYKVSKETSNSKVSATILDATCGNEVADATGAITLNETVIPNVDKPYDSAEVLLEFSNPDVLSQTSLWTDDGSGSNSGTLNFCVKAEYIFIDATTGEEIVVSYTETTFLIDFSLTSGFEVSQINDINKNNSTIIQKEAGFQVEACFCTTNNICIENPVMEQNSMVKICVTPLDDALHVQEFHSFYFMQEGIAKFRAIHNGQPTSITDVQIGGHTGVIETRAVTSLFENLSPVTAIGEVKLEYISEGGNPSRALTGAKAEQKSSQFELKFQPSATHSSFQIFDQRQDEIFMYGMGGLLGLFAFASTMYLRGYRLTLEADDDSWSQWDSCRTLDTQ